MRSTTLTILLALLFPLISGGQPIDHTTSSSLLPADEPQTIHIYGINSMKYVVKKGSEALKTGDTVKASGGKKYLRLKNIAASPGEKFQIKLTTVGDLPASAMSHNWILFTQDADLEAFAKAAMTAKDNGYIPEKHADDIIAHTSLAAGGETVEVTFTVPEKKGAYDFICSFPGHYKGGMQGKLIVE